MASAAWSGPGRERCGQPGPLGQPENCPTATTCGRLTHVLVSAPGWAGEEPTVTSHHEEALGRNQRKTTSQGRGGGWTATENAPRTGEGSREAGESPIGTHPVRLTIEGATMDAAGCVLSAVACAWTLA